MHYAIKSLVTHLLVTIFAVGCSSQPLTPTSPSPDTGSTTRPGDQTAGAWTLLSIRLAGQTEEIVPADASYTLMLADGRASTKADCNVCNGNLVVGGQTLTIGPLMACTRAACPTMAFENTYTAILAGESAVQIEGNSLTLISPRGVLRFRR